MGFCYLCSSIKRGESECLRSTSPACSPPAVPSDNPDKAVLIVFTCAWGSLCWGMSHTQLYSSWPRWCRA